MIRFMKKYQGWFKLKYPIIRWYSIVLAKCGLIQVFKLKICQYKLINPNHALMDSLSKSNYYSLQFY